MREEEIMSFKYCLFDLDGTLTDPAIGITNSVMHALEKYGIHVEDRSELYPFIGIIHLRLSMAFPMNRR